MERIISSLRIHKQQLFLGQGYKSVMSLKGHCLQLKGRSGYPQLEDKNYNIIATSEILRTKVIAKVIQLKSSYNAYLSYEHELPTTVNANYIFP